ncbi:MAG: hypothetical protein GXY85_07685 [Candidatus Brocadiaceae bacterium]|nr:hypothetical protein [Candidatus Brocadiaceae bacterium]
MSSLIEVEGLSKVYGVRGGVEVQAAECVLTVVPGAAIMPAAGAWVPAAHA